MNTLSLSVSNPSRVNGSTLRNSLSTSVSSRCSRDSAGGAGTATRDLCQGTRFRGLARPHPATELLWWQSAARAHLEDGAARPETAAYHRRDGCGALQPGGALLQDRGWPV